MNPVTGGPCQGIRNMIPELESKGYNNNVLCLDDPRADFVGHDSFKLIPLGPQKTAWQYSERLYPWLLEHLLKFDTVVVHGLWTYHGYAVNKAFKHLKKKHSQLPKLYVMPHGMLDPYFQKAETRKLKAVRNFIYWKVVEQHLVNNSNGILFTSETEMILARQSFKPYHPESEINVGYGIPKPPPFFQNMKNVFLQKCPALTAKSYILFISRIHEKKGVDILLSAYKKVKKENAALPALIIAGPGLDSDYGKKMIDASLTATDVHFINMLAGDAKWGAFYGCEAFILPSHQENFGIAVAEALACGKPVLITDKVNIWREITDCNAGFASNDDEAGIISLLKNWLQLSCNEKKEMSQNATECYHQHFAVEQAANKWVETIYLD